ncbi:hypothetical protein QR680_007882 [Steinernema hermaphroditum]|uniref:Uncharacterized protein n=1 Tax=Steinernema hermaphroditum TaxID=289476 RepID=A0AA39IFY4_9BILA|nr:hypothetical protein QR680_007882 [Steinernema hermaphroditum]
MENRDENHYSPAEYGSSHRLVTARCYHYSPNIPFNRYDPYYNVRMIVVVDFFREPPVHSKVAQWTLTFLSFLLYATILVLFLLPYHVLWPVAVIGVVGGASHVFLAITLRKQFRHDYRLMAVYLIYEVAMLLCTFGAIIHGIVQLDYLLLSLALVFLIYRLIIIRFFKAYYHFVRMRAPDVARTVHLSADSRTEEEELQIC